jgi:hypothetical protein
MMKPVDRWKLDDLGWLGRSNCTYVRGVSVERAMRAPFVVVSHV